MGNGVRKKRKGKMTEEMPVAISPEITPGDLDAISIFIQSGKEDSGITFSPSLYLLYPGMPPERILFRLLRQLPLSALGELHRHLKNLIHPGKTDLTYSVNFSGYERTLKHSIHCLEIEGHLRYEHFIIDITLTHQKLKEIKISESRLRKLFETAEDLIFILDAKGNFILINANGALALEYIPEELTGKHFLEFVSEDKKSVVARSFSEIVKSDKIITFESSFISKYGKTIIFEINARVTSSNGTPEGVLGIGRNVTSRSLDQDKMRDLNNKLIEANRIISIERDRARQKISVLEELNRLKNDFVSNISHELRTPLASIIGFSETIESDPSMPVEMRGEFNNIILSEAKRLSKLINNVLDLSQMEEGNITLNKEYFKLDEFLSPILNSYNRQAELKGLHFVHEIPEGEILLYADKSSIARVFDNLLSNAVKFTDKDGRITLFIKSFFKEIEIIVSDTGIGIPKNDIPFIFQKFYRVSRPGSQIPGTGLGLALTKQIVDLHKGLITIHSEENKGSTFVIKLPIIKQRAD